MSLHLIRSALCSARMVRRTPQLCAWVWQKQELFLAGRKQTLLGYNRDSIQSSQDYVHVYGARALCTPPVSLTDDDGIREHQDGDVDHALQSTKTAEEVLQIVDLNELTGENASLAIHYLVQHCFDGKGESYTSLQKLPSDPRVQKLYKALAVDIKDVNINHMIRALLNTYSLRLGTKYGAALATLVEYIRPKLRTVDVSVLSTLVSGAGVLKSSKGSKGLNRASGLVDEAARILDLRQRELGRLRPHALVGLLQVSRHFPPSFQTVIGDALLGSLHMFSFVDLKNLTLTMAGLPLRSPAILRAVIFQAIQLKEDWKLPSVAKFLRALGQLSFHNQDLAKQVAEFVVSKQSDWTPSLIGEIARAYTLLRIHVPEWGLFDQICEYTNDNLDDFSRMDLFNILYAFGELGHSPSNEKEFYKKITKYLETRFADYPFPSKVKLAAALMVCDQMPEFMLKDVLQQKPSTSNDSSIFQDILLMRLNTHAHLACRSYDGPYLEEMPTVSHHSSALGKSVVQALKEALGGSKCVRTFVGTTLGYKLDALVLLDESSRPVPVEQYQLTGVQSNEQGHSVQDVLQILDIHQKPVPEEYQKIAVVTWSTKERMFEKEELTGRYKLQKKHLELAGYKLVEVDYQEWNKARTKFQQISLIKFKLVEAAKKKADNIQQ